MLNRNHVVPFLLGTIVATLILEVFHQSEILSPFKGGRMVNKKSDREGTTTLSLSNDSSTLDSPHAFSTPLSYSTVWDTALPSVYAVQPQSQVCDADVAKKFERKQIIAAAREAWNFFTNLHFEVIPFILAVWSVYLKLLAFIFCS